MKLAILSLVPLVALIDHVTSEETCAMGTFYDRKTFMCKTCTACPEITKRVCHQDTDSVCASFKDAFLFNPRFFMYKDSAKPSVQNNLNAREKTHDDDVIREYQWHHVTLALTCILCTLSTILVVLIVVACMLYKKSRKESTRHIIPAFHSKIRGEHFQSYIVEPTEKIALVTDS